MTKRLLVLLKIIMWVVALMHLIVGAGLITGPGFARYMADVYGAEVRWTKELMYLLKPLGAFMCTLGVLAAVAAWNPVRHRAVMAAFVFLFLVRAAQRVIWRDEVQQAFGISASRNVANMIFFASMAFAILVLDRLVCLRTRREQNNNQHR